jgi:hypothetical protein
MRSQIYGAGSGRRGASISATVTAARALPRPPQSEGRSSARAAPAPPASVRPFLVASQGGSRSERRDQRP